MAITRRNPIHLNLAHKGALHKQLGKAADAPLSMATLEAAKQSRSPLERRRATFALNARQWNH